MLQAGQVQNTKTAQSADGSQPLLNLGRQGDLLVTEFHGKRYYKSARGQLFTANFGGAAGVSVIAAGGTSAVALLYNPVGSGVLVELEKIRISGATVLTDVVAGLALEGNVQVPSATTPAASINGMPLGSSPAAPLAKAYQAATITAMSFIGGLGLTIQATTSPMSPGEVDFDGTIVLAPGFAINLVSSVTQSTNKLVVDFVWSEHLP